MYIIIDIITSLNLKNIHHSSAFEFVFNCCNASFKIKYNIITILCFNIIMLLAGVPGVARGPHPPRPLNRPPLYANGQEHDQHNRHFIR